MAWKIIDGVLLGSFHGGSNITFGPYMFLAFFYLQTFTLTRTLAKAITFSISISGVGKTFF